MSIILTCPECATRYVANAEGFNPPGRNVRCSRCQHAWFETVEAPEAYETLYNEYEGDDAAAFAEQLRTEEPLIKEAPAFSNAFTAQTFEEDREPSFSDSFPGTGEAAPFEAERRRRGSRLVSGMVGLFGTVAIMGVLITGAWYFRPQIIELIPQSETLYALLPVAEAPSRYDLVDTAYVDAMENGQHVLIVSGNVVNKTEAPIKVPVVQITIRTIDEKDLDVWKFKPRGTEILPGESRYFESRRIDPPEGAQLLHIEVIEED